MNFTAGNDSVPADDELEVSLFGPGIGECVVVHLGQGDWMVVDSCFNDSRTEPIAIEYLKKLGVDIRNQVKLVVLTHWHDDHVRGAARLFGEAGSARFACSAALQNKAFFEILAVTEQVRPVVRNSSTTEFRHILEELQRRKQRGARRSQAGPDHWVHDGLPLFPSTDGMQVSVTALSPSAQTITDSIVRFASLIPKVSGQITRLPRCTPNDQSVALLIQSEFISVLLGADLETVGDPDRGWQAVVNSPVRPQVKAHAIKVSHHGSANGDHDGIWSTLLEPDATAILTPYAAGKQPLPTEADVQRLKSRTSRVYCTSWPPTRKPPKRHGGVDRTIREMTRMHRSINRNVGHIRLRASLARFDLPVLDTFSGAQQL